MGNGSRNRQPELGREVHPVRRLAWQRPGVLYRASLIAFLLQALAAPAQERFTAAESRGRLIYTSGQSVAGQPLSYRILGAGDDVLPAKGVYCASCHGL